jgi:hypothetical protein
MHVASIDWSNNKRNLNIFVTVHDESHTNSVSGARVEMTLQHIGGNAYNFAGNTDASGQVKFTLRGISPGLCFDATVTNVSKTDWVYNSNSNDETSDTYCIP